MKVLNIYYYRVDVGEYSLGRYIFFFLYIVFRGGEGWRGVSFVFFWIIINGYGGLDSCETVRFY